jgi:hypothetical protein
MGWTASAAANSQETVLGKLRGKYISVKVPIPTCLILPLPQLYAAQESKQERSDAKAIPGIVANALGEDKKQSLP